MTMRKYSGFWYFCVSHHCSHTTTAKKDIKVDLLALKFNELP